MGILSKLKRKKDIDNKISNENQKVIGKIFIFSIQNNLNIIMNNICKHFNIDNEDRGNNIELKNNDIEISVDVFTSSMNGETGKFIEEQINRTYGHFYNVDTKHTDIKTNLLYKISTSKGFISISYSFIKDDNFDKKAMIEYEFIDILDQIEGIMLIIDENQDGFYCKGKEENTMELILSDDGNSSLSKYVPDEKFTMKAEKGGLTKNQINRRLRSRKIIKHKSIYVPAWYPVIEDDTEAKCRNPREIAERAVALLIVSLYSECRLGENMNHQEAYDFVRDIIERFDAEKFLSPEENAYINNPDSEESEQIAYSWKYENLFVMEWALGFIDELDFPDHICDVPLTVKILNSYNSIEEIINNSKPKTFEKLLDECDLIFCLDWACVDTRIHNLPAPANMDKGVVFERHKSLNWLVGCNDRADWDDVETNT